MSDEATPADETVTEEEVLGHLTHVAHRVAKRLAELLPDSQRAEAAEAAAEILTSDEGARELLAAAYDEGRASVALSGGVGGVAPDWSDIERGGERRAIAREEHICGTCSARDVCAVAVAMKQIEALVVLQRCDRHR